MKRLVVALADYELALEDVRAIRDACDTQAHCAILRALFDDGEVRQGTFADVVRPGF